MVKTIIKKFKWFWVWQDEAEQDWLGEMSRKGYHLSSVALPGIYTFIVGEPRDYFYRMDYQPYSKKDRHDYLQLFHDAGWEYISNMSSWQYFRKEARHGETPEIFTDVESKVAKYKRVLTYLAFFLLCIWPGLLCGVLSDVPYPWFGGVQVFTLIVALLLTYAVIRLALRIKQLRRL